MTRLARRLDGTVTPLRIGPLVDDTGLALIPSAATLVVTLDDGSALTLVSVPVIDALTGIVTLTWDAGESATLAASMPRLDCRADWTLTVAGSPVFRTQYFDVWQRDIYTSVSDALLVDTVPELDARRSKLAGVATGGTTSTLIDTGRFSSDRGDAWVDARLRFTSGANAGQQRRVNASTATTSTLTFAPVLANPVSARDTYELHRSWNPQIRSAFDELMARVQEWLGRYAQATMRDGEDLSAAHLHLSVAHACRAVATGSAGDAIRERANEHQDRAENALSQRLVKYGSDDQDQASSRTMRAWGSGRYGDRRTA